MFAQTPERLKLRIFHISIIWISTFLYYVLLSTSNSTHFKNSNRNAKRLYKRRQYNQTSVNLYRSLGKFSRRQIDDILSYFPWKTCFDISCKLSHVSLGNNLHEMFNLILGKKLSSSEIIT